MRSKRRFWLGVSAALSVVILALVFLLRGDTTTQSYREYKAWAATFKTHDWSISQEGAEAFAEANCEPFARGNQPGFIVKNENHLKATAAIVEAYCPESLKNYLKSVEENERYNGEYSDTIASIRKAVRR